MITDDGDLVSQSRVLIPETMMISETKDAFKKLKREKEYEQTNCDNGVGIEVTEFDLDGNNDSMFNCSILPNSNR